MDPATASLLAGAATGGVGAGLNYFQNKDANEQNLAMFNQNMMNTNSQITAARDYNTKMADTAHQREVADLKAAGINPMMTAMGGSGAPAPTSPVSNTGVGNAIQPNRAIGDAITGLVGNALSAARTLEEIKNVNKDSLLKDAQAIASAAQAQMSTASAKESAERTAQLELGRGAAGAEAKARENKANLDLNLNKAERILNMVGTGSGAINNAAGAVSKFITPNLGKIFDTGFLTGVRHGTPLP